MSELFLTRMKDVQECFGEALLSVRNDVVRLSESPIETAFADAILTCQTALECRLPVFIDPSQPFRPTSEFQISPQRPIGQYRADFAMMFGSSDSRIQARVVVECDGHAFHEKTKAQAARDKMRDRAFLAQGWPVMRFTGSELHADPGKCADEAATFLFDEWVKLAMLGSR